VWPSLADLRHCIGSILRGTGLGAILGVLPGGGALLASFAAYTLEKNVARPPRNFGDGDIRGVAAPESANNAGAQTSFIPMLTLGIPSNPTMALMIGALTIQGIAPGPQVMTERPALFWGLIASMWVGNLMLLVLNLPLVGLWVKLLAIPQPWLYAGILVFATMGTIAAKPSVVELSMLAAFGVLGFLMRRFDFPIAPVVVGLILGPIAESQLRRALAISLGDPLVLLQSPMSATLLGIALVALLAPFVLKGLGRFRASED
jgi:putative tricarboxylic transport membrane protein